MTEIHASENSYLFETENASEVARLLHRNDFLREALGGPLPEQTTLHGMKRILDIGSGPGGWAIDVARIYPDIEVIGIDISDTMLNTARFRAKGHKLQNIIFTKMNALHPLEFPDQHFDLVNMRAAVEYIPRNYWQALLQECYRVTRPGGSIRVMEADRMGNTNSRAFEQFHTFYAALLYEQGYGFSPDGSTFGITPMVGKFLHDVGYQDIRVKPYALNFSHASLFQTHYQSIVETRFDKLRTQLIAKKHATLNELADLYTTLLADISQETFCGICYPLLFQGQK
jgi:ubiquinone/menaquinone biosynthesis C-methylase UbiE